jgi:hypothetical protein
MFASVPPILTAKFYNTFAKSATRQSAASPEGLAAFTGKPGMGHRVDSALQNEFGRLIFIDISELREGL